MSTNNFAQALQKAGVPRDASVVAKSPSWPASQSAKAAFVAAHNAGAADVEQKRDTYFTLLRKAYEEAGIPLDLF